MRAKELKDVRKRLEEKEVRIKRKGCRKVEKEEKE